MMPMVHCPEWSDDNARTDAHRTRIAKAYRDVAKSAAVEVISPEDPPRWHRIAFEGLVPVDYYAGNYRQDDPARPCLGVNVLVGGVSGASYSVVVAVTRSAFEAFRRELISLDVHWDSLTPRQRAMKLCQVLAIAIAEFIRIHPFVNGNGRMSRLLWTWGLLRYGLPPQCRIGERPPEVAYAQLMSEAMKGNPAPLALEILIRMGRAVPAR